MDALVSIQRRWRRTAVAMIGATIAVVACAGVARAATVATFSIPTADSDPTSLVVGPDNDLYFGEQNVYKVGRIDMAGNITEFPVPDDAPGVADVGPAHLTSSGGAIWLLTDVGQSLYRMDTSGNLERFTWDGSDGIDLGPSDQGGVWVYDELASDNSGSDQIQQVDASGKVTAFQTDEMNQSFAPLALAPDGSEWYAEDAGGSDYLDNITDVGVQNKVPIQTGEPTYEVTSLGLSSDGTLWFTEHEPYDFSFPVGGAIGMLAPGSSAPQIVWSTSGNQDVGPTSLTAGPNGVMYVSYVSGSGTSSGIGEITPSGQVTLESLAPYKPESVVYGADGNLWFVDTTANMVGRVSPSDLFRGGAGGGGGGGGGGNGAGGTPTTTATTPTTDHTDHAGAHSHHADHYHPIQDGDAQSAGGCP